MPARRRPPVEEGRDLPHHVVGLSRAHQPMDAGLGRLPLGRAGREERGPLGELRAPPWPSAPRHCPAARGRAAPWPRAPRRPRATPRGARRRSGPRPRSPESPGRARGRHRPADHAPPAEWAVADGTIVPHPVRSWVCIGGRPLFAVAGRAATARGRAVRVARRSGRARPRSGDDPAERGDRAVSNNVSAPSPDSRATTPGVRCECRPCLAPCRASTADGCADRHGLTSWFSNLCSIVRVFDS